MAHTPGPWYVYPGKDGEYYVLAGDYAKQGEPDLIIKVTSADPAADARLIAAAPELYEALKTLCEASYENLTGGEWDSLWREAEKLLEKIEKR